MPKKPKRNRIKVDQNSIKEEILEHIYKITSEIHWKKDSTLALQNIDDDFIHFAELNDIDRIASKYFSNHKQVHILEVDPSKLVGKLIKEKNPGGVSEYYHLYEGHIPKKSVVSYSTRLVTR